MMKTKIERMIERRNQKWNATDRTGKKLLICEDVLSMLKISKYQITPGTYCKIPGTHRSWGEDLGSLGGRGGLLENKITCEVCARGAMMLSKFRFAGSDAFSRSGTLDSAELTRSELDEVFTKDELKRIESVFERRAFHEDYESVDGENNGVSNKRLSLILKNFSKDPDERLSQIMKRIIKFKGDVECALESELKLPVQ